MPPVGASVSLDTEMQKFLPEKTVTPSPGQKPRMTPDSAEVSAASLTWTNAEPDM
ncbi:group II intron reverse transcriptase/maturase, partial [Pseudomonas aeruginosa]